MLKTNAVAKCLVDVSGNHLANSVVVGVSDYIECPRSAGRTEEAMNCREIGIMRGLMEKLHELAERLMNEEQIAQRNRNHPVGRNSVQAILHALSDSPVLQHKVGVK